MPLFGRRRAENQALSQRQAVLREALETAQSAFNTRFRAWLDAVEQTQVITDADTLTDDIISRVGPVPRPQITDDLNDTQRYSMASYAHSYGSSMLERRTVSAVVAASQAENSGDDSAMRLNSAATYWQSVQAYVTQALAS